MDPVVTYTSPWASTAASYQSPAPSNPSGIVLCVHSRAPVSASYARTCPCTNGTSQFDEMPTITLPLATVGLDQA